MNDGQLVTKAEELANVYRKYVANATEQSTTHHVLSNMRRLDRRQRTTVERVVKGISRKAAAA